MHERPQPGNPHQLTIAQHIFPAASIRRFCDTNGLVRVTLVGRNHSFTATPDAEIFCAKRAWSEWAEHGFMIDTEREYQRVANRYIIQQGVLDAADERAVTRMFCLWNIRFRFRNIRPSSPKPPDNFVGLSREVTKDDEEYLEKNRITTIRSDGRIAPRHLVGAGIFLNFESATEAMGRCRWLCVTFDHGNLVVPDNFSQFGYVPLTSNRAFVVEEQANLAAEELNRLASAEAEAHYFQSI